MSLRIFHIVFVVICVGLSLWVGLWGVREYVAQRNTAALSLGVLFLLSGVALVVYGTKVFNKLRDLP